MGAPTQVVLRFTAVTEPLAAGLQWCREGSEGVPGMPPNQPSDPPVGGVETASGSHVL